MVRFKLDDEEDEEIEKESRSVFRGRLEDKIDEVLLKQRKLFFSSPVDDAAAKDAIRKLWYLDYVDPGKPILFIINSPGGSVDSGFAIWDQAKMLRSPIVTLITGLAASMGSILSLCAKKESRFATPHSRIMIHQPAIHGVVRGQATDLEIQAKEILKTRDTIINIYVDATGRDFDTIQKALDRDTWMSADEAVNFGLIHKVINSYEELNKALTR